MKPTSVIELIQKFPNDSDLGYQIRSLKHIMTPEIVIIIDKYINDQSLGEFIRSKIRKFYN